MRRVADLVLLDVDPLADTRNTQEIRAVVLNGRWLDRKALDEMKGRLEASAPTGSQRFRPANVLASEAAPSVGAE